MAKHKHNDPVFGYVGSSGNMPYPYMIESPPQLCWTFIHKVYVILCMQLLLTITVAFTIMVVHPITKFIAKTRAGLAVWIGQLILPFLWRVVLEAVVLTAVVVVGLTLYTFWAARRGKNFSFLGLFLFAALLVLIVFGIIQMFFSQEKVWTMIYGALGALIFSGYIIYDTDELIKRHSYDDYA